jgi:membrane protease YdiL (CAAX protease family)
MAVTTGPRRGLPAVRSTWFAAHPLSGALLVTVLTALGLQLTHMIGFQERVAELVGWTLRVRFLDFAFRNVLGALVVIAVLPYLFGHLRRRQWFRPYRRYIGLVSGPTPRLTAAAAATSVLTLTVMLVGLAGALDVLRVDFDFWLEDSRWFIVILSLVPGIWEELAFRGLMLSNLQQRYHRWVAVVVTAFLFGLMHFTNLLLREPGDVLFEVTMATAVGIAWGYMTVKTGSVLPAMASHYLINVLIGLTLDPVLSETASAVIFGSVTIAYPVVTIVTMWWLAQRSSARRPRRTRIS